MTYCRIPHEKIADLSSLIYFITRTESSEVYKELEQAFVDECQNLDSINFDRMPDRSLRMFTWVFLSAMKDRDELNAEPLIQTHIERMS